MTRSIPLAQVHPHPRNPRLAPRQDVVDQIAAQIKERGFDEAHALIVRPNADGFEIIAGHQRRLAAIQAGIDEVPCWVREMSDEDAYMALALDNAQGELEPLEVGMHALGVVAPGKHGTSAEAYAKRIGRDPRDIRRQIAAAEVATQIGDVADLVDRVAQLAEIHVACEWAWPALVEAMIEEGWSVEKTRKQAATFKADKRGRKVPHWIGLDLIAKAILAGEADPVNSMLDAYDKAKATIAEGKVDAERLLEAIETALGKMRLTKLSDLQAVLNPILDEQQKLVAEQREKELAEQRENEARQARLKRLRSYVSLDEWKTLSPEEQRDLLAFGAASGPNFNKQESADIEWAQWSWNPITGCLHDCPYCYARDIAHQKRMEKVYPHGFEPTLRPVHLLAPLAQKPPAQSKTDARFRNVFTGSMADMFGRWVPDEWIDAVLTQMRAASQWNFLCLTKFPKRMAEFDIPANAWMGTTIDLQARVASAEAAFARIGDKAGVRWLSIEPLLEPLKFKRLDLFNWIVIGGASPSTQTPEWVPPVEWVFDLCEQARAAGCRIYMKTNLGIRNRIVELPFDAPVKRDLPDHAPEVFHYLGKRAEIEP